MANLTNDFFGLLANSPMKVKKERTLDIYKFYYRFSMEKVELFINSPVFMLILVQYIKHTQMQRIH